MANQLAFTPLEKISGIVPQVAFPAFSKLQSDNRAVVSNYLKGLKFLNLIVFPGYVCMIMLVPDIVNILLGPKWLGIVEPMRILCIIMPLRALDILFIPVMNGLGKSHITAAVSGSSLLIISGSFLIGLRWGYIGLCWGWVVGFTIIYILMVIACRKFVKIPITSFVGCYTTAAICCVLVMSVNLLLIYGFGSAMHSIWRILMTVSASALVCLLTIYWLDKPVFLEIKSILKIPMVG